LLEETTEAAPGGGGASSVRSIPGGRGRYCVADRSEQKELVEAKTTISTQAQTIKEVSGGDSTRRHARDAIR
jgi:hypothetical protein